MSCKSVPSCYGECNSCSVCENINISESDSKFFKHDSFNILKDECVVFRKGNISAIDGNFFNQFPETNRIYFEYITTKLKVSGKNIPNRKLVFIKFLRSIIHDVTKIKAFKSLEKLRQLEIIFCDLFGHEINQTTWKYDLKLEKIIVKK